MTKVPFSRRRFFKIAGAGSLAIAGSSVAGASSAISAQPQEEPVTNIADAARVPRNDSSMPGKYPGRVVKICNDKAVKDNAIVEEEAYDMVMKGMLMLTGDKNLKKAWRRFVKPGERIGLKVNPVAGPQLTTSHAVTKAVIRQLEDAGISRSDLTIWDRREHQLHETGYTAENYPGIRITGTERKDEGGSFYGTDGKLYSEHVIDREWYYHANINGEYDEYTLPHMVNGGEYSYFTGIVTKELDKIINIPILKNAGATTTNALKNLAFGSVTNTSRLHGKLWHETCAHVCAFAPLRDKVVLNITDGIKGCFNGGPGANPQFFTNYNTILVGTDPVAMDRIAHEIIVAKRIEEGIQKTDNPASYRFLQLAEDLELGVCARDRIEVIS
jgi:uncharacterized protein (DUF362 family)